MSKSENRFKYPSNLQMSFAGEDLRYHLPRAMACHALSETFKHQGDFAAHLLLFELKQKKANSESFKGYAMYLQQRGIGLWLTLDGNGLNDSYDISHDFTKGTNTKPSHN